ncbi:MAG TPA: lytic transglycosylase domain-containing protein [Bryobacteraceae bacterium]
MTRFPILLVGALLAVPGFASELVCLKTGFCLHADSHTQKGANLRLQVGSGSIEIPPADIAGITSEPSSPANRPEPVKASVANTDPRLLLAEAAEAEGIDADFVRSVARVESGFRPDAVSSKGALGLMQLMPGTAKELAVDPMQARENALGGAKYLRALLLRYHYNSALALAAYNAGPGAVARFGGVPPYAETRNYVLKVTREYDRLRAERARALKAAAMHAPKPGNRDGAEAAEEN